MMNVLVLWHVFDITINSFDVMTYFWRHDVFLYAMILFLLLLDAVTSFCMSWRNQS